MIDRILATASVLALSLAACSQAKDAKTAAAAPSAQSAPAPQPTPAGQSTAGASAPANLTPAAVNGAQFQAGAGGDQAAGAADTANSKAPDPVLVRAEVLLDRANFKPGVIDGRMGENVADAIAAYAKVHNLPATRSLTPQVWQALTSADNGPVLKTYTITQADVAGPWTPSDVGEDFVKMAQQPASGYTSAQEMLAERFHMDQDFLKALNPQADFSKAGTQIVVVDAGQPTLAGEVAVLKVDKTTKSVTAYDDNQKLLAVFPATVGSTERPSPHGWWKVKGVAQNPDYTYDPSKLTWGPKHAGKLHIPPGPNNPVGVVWIALTAPDYGIHGTPDPHLVGKTASHGCVRLTNWDAEELSKAVKPGVKVDFVS